MFEGFRSYSAYRVLKKNAERYTELVVVWDTKLDFITF